MPDAQPLGRLGHVILPVADFEASVRFCRDVLGLPLRFRDGDRYAAFDAGGATIALATPDEQSSPGRIELAIRVDDIDAARSRVEDAVEVGELAESQHERRAPFTDPAGNAFVLYQPR